MHGYNHEDFSSCLYIQNFSKIRRNIGSHSTRVILHSNLHVQYETTQLSNKGTFVVQEAKSSFVTFVTFVTFVHKARKLSIKARSNQRITCNGQLELPVLHTLL